MPVAITTRRLPGIGVCHEMTLTEGARLAVVTRRNGLRDVAVYDVDDADEARVDVVLNEQEANALAELLGGPQLMNTLSGVGDIGDTNALNVQQLPLDRRSPFVRRPLGDTQARTRTGVSIVAVARNGMVHPSPGPDFVLQDEDLIAVVGTDAAIERLAAILDGTDQTADRGVGRDNGTATATDTTHDLAPPG